MRAKLMTDHEIFVKGHAERVAEQERRKEPWRRHELQRQADRERGADRDRRSGDLVGAIGQSIRSRH